MKMCPQNAMPQSQSFYRKMRAHLRGYKSARSAYYFALALGIVLRDGSSRSREELDTVFARPDPWNYARVPEQRRHQAELEMLDGAVGKEKFGSAVEIGCAEGIFTSKLALRCEKLVALDISEAALQRASLRCKEFGHVAFELGDVRDWPIGKSAPYDLIVAIHVLEYVRSPFSLYRLRRAMIHSVRVGGHLLLGNVYQDSVSEGASWGRVLLHGGNWINAFMSAHPGVQIVAARDTDLGDCVSKDLLLRRVS
jgi:2-polyprenyl-3-methyl-5-hydroxy-6-metoxy-1,4-benzoquinol methylase